jgi:hypothetical protein
MFAISDGMRVSNARYAHTRLANSSAEPPCRKYRGLVCKIVLVLAYTEGSELSRLCNDRRLLACEDLPKCQLNLIVYARDVAVAPELRTRACFSSGLCTRNPRGGGDTSVRPGMFNMTSICATLANLMFQKKCSERIVNINPMLRRSIVIFLLASTMVQ